MGQEGPPQEKSADERERQETTPRRLKFLNEKFVEAHISKTRVRGLENLDKIPTGKKVIIVTTHLTDLDMPIVLKELGARFNIAVADMSPHHNLTEDTAGFAANTLAGMKNFMPIDYTPDKQALFHPENFVAMKKELEDKRKTAMIAGHNPTKDKMEMPDKGGYGGAYLASITSNAIILPVAVSLRSEKPIGFAGNFAEARRQKPEADVIIGEPIELPKIQGAEKLPELMEKTPPAMSRTAEARAQFSDITTQLRKQSALLMTRLAEMLPEGKRGGWKKNKDRS